MRILVLSAFGALPDGGAAATAWLQAGLAGRGDVRTVDLASARIAHCRACGGCSHKHPGRCGVQDDMQGILPRLVRSDLLVLATPVFFGGHHPVMKQAVDRFLPLHAPVWTARANELHSRMRYPMPALLGVGLLGPGREVEAGTFEHLLRRHAVNMDVTRFACVTVPGHQVAGAADGRLAAALAEVGAGR